MADGGSILLYREETDVGNGLDPVVRGRHHHQGPRVYTAGGIVPYSAEL